MKIPLLYTIILFTIPSVLGHSDAPHDEPTPRISAITFFGICLIIWLLMCLLILYLKKYQVQKELVSTKILFIITFATVLLNATIMANTIVEVVF